MPMNIGKTIASENKTELQILCNKIMVFTTSFLYLFLILKNEVLDFGDEPVKDLVSCLLWVDS